MRQHPYVLAGSFGGHSFYCRKHLHVDIQACALIWTLHDDERRLRREMELMIVSRFTLPGLR